MKKISKKHINKISSLGYTGVDMSIETSLEEYGQVSRIDEQKNTIYVIYCRNDINNNLLFDYTIIDFDELFYEDAIENMFNDKNFVNFLGYNHADIEAMLKLLYQHDIYMINQFIFDCNQWNGLYMQSTTFKYSLDKCIR
jgi:hypothetical protein